MSENILSISGSPGIQIFDSHAIRIFDSHAHYDSGQFDSDREQLLGETLPQKGVIGILNMGSDIPGCETTVKLCRRYAYVYGAAGIHPE